MNSKKTPIELRALKLTGKQAEKLLKQITPTAGPLVDPPAWFTDEQKTAWHYAVANAPKQILRTIDRAILAAFIVAEDLHRKAAIALQNQDLIVTSPNGFHLQSAYLPILNKQMLNMIRAAGELGFTPCSRARIDTGKASAETAVTDWDEVKTA